MAFKFQIIRIDNLTVRKMDLQVGDNIIGNDLYTDSKDEITVREAVNINVSEDGEISITPFEGVSCYLKNYGSAHWKNLRANWTVPLKVRDTCLLFPIKIWFRVISAMDVSDEIKSVKRKVETESDDELPDKRCRSEAQIEIEPSNYIINNNCDAPYLVPADSDENMTEYKSIDDSTENQSINDKKDFDLIQTDLAQCPINNDIKNKESESFFESHSTKQEVEQLDLNNDVDKHIDEKINSENAQCPTDADTEVMEETVATKNNTDQLINNTDTETQLVSAIKTDTDCDQLVNDTSNNDTSIKVVEENKVVTNSINNTGQVLATDTKRKKEKCKYGDKCYRLNVEHKAKFSHPGDIDYNLADNRPECPYGVSCYRKNPQHKLDYKHNLSNRRPRTPASARTISGGDLSDLEESEEESVDESEYEASFIDDESMDDSFEEFD